MPHARRSIFFNAEKVSAILEESSEKIGAYVSDVGFSVVCLPTAYLAFLVNFYPIFTYHMMGRFIFWYLIGISDYVPSNTSNAGLTGFSSFIQASIQKVLPFSLSVYMA